MKEIEKLKETSKIELILKELESSEFKISENIYFGDFNIDIEKSLTKDTPLIIKGFSAILINAVEIGATDIHIEPFEKEVRIRYRVDGELIEIKKLHKNISGSIIARLKIMSNLDISEKRVPQDGRMKIKIKGNILDFRVGIIPTIHGEKAVIRILNSEILNLKLDMLGFSPINLEKILNSFTSSSGIILLSGPTGSGKTTTLNAILQHLNTIEKNISTVEDPVEYNIYGITQIQARPEIGLDFSTVLRQLLRQDPDILMIGEIRDLETSEIAIRAALTGHLVFSTIHTKDAPSTIVRLLNMGIESYLISSSISLVISQRLVRKLCENCSIKDEEWENKLMKLGVTLFEIEKIKEAKVNSSEINFYTCSKTGCKNCNNTGYKGRISIHEVMEMGIELKELIEKNGVLSEIQKLIKKQKMKTLIEDGIEKAKNKITSLEEIIKVYYR